MLLPDISKLLEEPISLPDELRKGSTLSQLLQVLEALSRLKGRQGRQRSTRPVRRFSVDLEVSDGGRASKTRWLWGKGVGRSSQRSALRELQEEIMLVKQKLKDQSGERMLLKDIEKLEKCWKNLAGKVESAFPALRAAAEVAKDLQ